MTRGDEIAVRVELATIAARRRRPAAAVRLLVVALAAAERAGDEPCAGALHRLLRRTAPRHAWAAAPAERDDETAGRVLKQLERRYPVERCEQLIERSGVLVQAPAADEPHTAFVGRLVRDLDEALGG